jgi:S-adenosylmethionine-diacylglycerol 3-amino-3-carboxypropyl transferase
MTAGREPDVSSRVAGRVGFNRIRYANCWEDSALLVAALQPAPGRRILSIASAGDNSLHLLAHGAEVVAADLSSAQLACVELRVAAIRQLGDHDALAFLGFYPADDDRFAVYVRIREGMSDTSRAFWDANRKLLLAGAIHGGRFEAYFRDFRTRVLPLVHSRRNIDALLRPRDAAARELFYERVWNTLRWRLLFRVFFSRFVMGRLGRDPEFFRYVEGSVADRILERTRYALTVLETHGNPYLRYVLTGGFKDAMPDWTRPEMLAGIRRHADRLTLVHGGIEAAAAAAVEGFDGFNLSDIFEYMSEADCVELYGLLLQRARPGARFAYWNMLAPRRCPDAYRARVSPLTGLAGQLFARDRAFFYSAFHVDEVVTPGACDVA